jgi:TorA maturation chaperone TorD
MNAPLGAAARRDLYALTARLFAAEVDVALYRALAAQNVLGLIDAELSAMGEERALEALAVEFCRLFVGPQPLCIPYASAHRGEALLGGRARTRLEAFLRRIGFTFDEMAMRIASPDHLAVELAVLAHLYTCTAADTATAIHEFLCDYVLPWVPAYCEQVAAAAALGFYRTTARLVAALCAEEAPSGKTNSRPG